MYVMEAFVLHPADIKLIDVDKDTTLFLHADKLQIYPLHDGKLIRFLKIYADGGYKAAIKAFGTENCADIMRFVGKKVESAPPTVNEPFLNDSSQVSYSGIVLPISAKCNLNCPYCFARTGDGFTFPDYTPESATRIIDFIISNIANPSDKTVLYFFGGEPMLNFPIMKFVVEYIKKKYPEYNIAYSATTNGTLRRRETLNFVRKNNIFLLLSIDGPDNEFNLRHYRNGRRSVNNVVKNIEYLKSNDIPLAIRSTIVTNNPYVYETYKFLEQLKVPFTVKFAYPSENKSHPELNVFTAESLARVKLAYDKLMKFYLERIRNREHLYNQALATINNSIRFRHRRRIACAAGIKQFTITGDGDIFTCPQLMNDKRFSVGNIRDGLLCKTSYTAVSVDAIEECHNCWAKYLCSGGCLSQKISAGLDIYKNLGGEACEAVRTEWEFMIKLYYCVVREWPELIGYDMAGVAGT